MRKWFSIILALSLVGSAYSVAFAEKKATITIPEGTNAYKIEDKEGNFVDLEFIYKNAEINVKVSVPDSETDRKVITIPLKNTGNKGRGNGSAGSSINDSIFKVSVPVDSVNHWARNDIMTMVQLGLLKGYPDGTFKPEKTITRAEYATLLERVLNMTTTVPDPVEETVFADVTPDAWFFGPVSSLVVRKNVNPAIYPERLFNPNAAIPREEIALWTAIDLPKSSSKEVKFKDELDLKHPTEVKKVAAAGLLKGFPDGTFRPMGHTTRAEAATMMVRFLKMKDVIKEKSE